MGTRQFREALPDLVGRQNTTDETLLRMEIAGLVSIQRNLEDRLAFIESVVSNDELGSLDCLGWIVSALDPADKFAYRKAQYETQYEPF